MHAFLAARRVTLLVSAVALAAGCAAPEESGPVDLNRDDDHNGIPDEEEQNATNTTRPTLPGLDVPGAPDQPREPVVGPS